MAPSPIDCVFLKDVNILKNDFFSVFLSCYSQRYEMLLKDMEKKSEQHREVLSSLQQEFQKAQGLAVGKVWPSDEAAGMLTYTQIKSRGGKSLYNVNLLYKSE